MATGRASPGSAAHIKQRVLRLRELPTLPATVRRITEIIDDPEVNLTEVAAIVETDQVLAAQVLRLANSAFYGVSGQIASLTHAIALLGTTITKSLLYTTSVLDLRKISIIGFWEHSVGCAVAAGALAKYLRVERPEEVSAAGLLHDLGKVVLHNQLPDHFAEVVGRTEREGLMFREAEMAVLSFDHTAIADWLTQRWAFPVRLAEPIVCHHRPATANAATVETAIVHVANTLVRAYGYGYGGDRRLPPVAPAAWKLLRREAEDLDHVIETFENDLERARDFVLFW